MQGPRTISFAEVRLKQQLCGRVAAEPDRETVRVTAFKLEAVWVTVDLKDGCEITSLGRAATVGRIDQHRRLVEDRDDANDVVLAKGWRKMFTQVTASVPQRKVFTTPP